MSTKQKKLKRRQYPSDISRNGWQQLKKYFHIPASPNPRPPADLKEVINAIFYVVKTGCSWPSMPHDLVCWQTAYRYFNYWRKDGTWEWIHRFLGQKCRRKAKRKSFPTAACLDSQSIKTTACGGNHRGFEAGKQIKGRKRFILTDT